MTRRRAERIGWYLFWAGIAVWVAGNPAWAGTGALCIAMMAVASAMFFAGLTLILLFWNIPG